MLRRVSFGCLGRFIFRGRVSRFQISTPSFQQDDRHYVLRQEATMSRFEVYFSEKLGRVNKQVREIIKEIGHGRSSVDRLVKTLSDFLDIHYLNRKQMKLGPLQLFSLLVVVNMHRDQRVLKFRKDIMQYLVRTDFELYEFDRLQMCCLIDGYFLMSKEYSKKKKSQFLTFMLFSVLEKKWQLVHFRYYVILMNIVLGEDIQNKIVFVRFSRVFIPSVLELFQKILDQGQLEENVVKTINHEKFIPDLLKIIGLFGCSQENVEVLFRFVDEYVMGERMLRDSMKLEYYLTVYRQFPARERLPDGNFYKSLILNKLVAYLKKIGVKNADYNYRIQHHFVSSVLHHLFLEHWRNLTFCQRDGLIYLEREQVKVPPELPELFWEVYDKFSHQINYNLATRDVIRDCYPSRYREHKLNKGLETRTPFIETEMRIRMQMVLSNLKMKARKQVNISNRFVDFLFEENIILEMDGRHHYHYVHFESDSNTDVRNMHLVLAGYRIIVISIYQYNLNRSVEQLGALFLRKWNLLKEQNCLAVL